MIGYGDEYQVAPTPRGGKWKVIRGFETLSKHNKKSAAKRQARQKAVEGDKLTIRKKDGTVQNKVTIS